MATTNAKRTAVVRTKTTAHSTTVALAPRNALDVILFVGVLVVAFGAVTSAVLYPPLVVVALAVMAWLVRALLSLRTSRAPVVVSADEIRIGLRWARSRYRLPALREGWVHPVSGGCRACVVVRGGYVIKCGFSDADSANAFLAPILKTSTIPNRLPLAWPRTMLGPKSLLASALLGASALAAVALTSAAGSGLVFLVVDFCWLGALPVIGYALMHSHLSFGHDGLLLAVPGERRFIAYEQITDIVALGPRKLVIRLVSGETIRIVLQTWTSFGTVDAESAAQWLQSCLAWARRSPERLEAAAFARNGRSLSDWRRALGAMFRAGYRAAGATPAAAAEILCDARHSAGQRIGAALALLDVNDPECAQALQRAADTCANPRLRVAFTEIAQGKITEDAIAALEDGAPEIAAVRSP